MNKRGYYGIGVFHGKTEENIGTLWRSAKIFEADFIFTIGRRYRPQSTDTCKTPRSIPLFNFENYEDFRKHIPYSCPVIAVELDENSIPIKHFVHPERCIYLLGAEDHGIPQKILNECQTTIQLPGDFSMNVATAGSIVMFDRFNKQ